LLIVPPWYLLFPLARPFRRSAPPVNLPLCSSGGVLTLIAACLELVPPLICVALLVQPSHSLPLPFVPSTSLPPSLLPSPPSAPPRSPPSPPLTLSSSTPPPHPMPPPPPPTPPPSLSPSPMLPPPTSPVSARAMLAVIARVCLYPPSVCSECCLFFCFLFGLTHCSCITPTVFFRFSSPDPSVTSRAPPIPFFSLY